MTQLTTPETSTIMLRRNSALAHNKDGSSAATTPKSLNSSFDAKHSPGAVGKKPGYVVKFSFIVGSLMNFFLFQSFTKISNTTKWNAETAPKASQAIRWDPAGDSCHSNPFKTFLLPDRSTMFPYPNWSVADKSYCAMVNPQRFPFTLFYQKLIIFESFAKLERKITVTWKLWLFLNPIAPSTLNLTTDAKLI